MPISPPVKNCESLNFFKINNPGIEGWCLPLGNPWNNGMMGTK
jgi:hypothetical protein